MFVQCLIRQGALTGAPSLAPHMLGTSAVHKFIKDNYSTHPSSNHGILEKGPFTEFGHFLYLEIIPGLQDNFKYVTKSFTVFTQIY